MRVLVTGAAGMLGRTLLRTLTGHETVAIDVDECDITRPDDVDRAVGDAAPDCVIHCAAFTAVDDCETHPDRAWAVNALGSANVASACARAGARLLALSTDYVFSGDRGRPAHEWDEPAPRTVYGRTKLAGERAVRELCPNHLIARTAWLYGSGGPSFVHTMLRLGAEDGEPLKVVNDQRGNPTSTDALAAAIAGLVDSALSGTVHLSCEGEATWYDLTCELFRLAGLKRQVTPCTTDEFPRPAPRPADSRLEKRVLRLAGLPPMPNWRDALGRFLKEYPDR